MTHVEGSKTADVEIRFCVGYDSYFMPQVKWSKTADVKEEEC